MSVKRYPADSHGISASIVLECWQSNRLPAGKSSAHKGRLAGLPGGATYGLLPRWSPFPLDHGSGLKRRQGKGSHVWRLAVSAALETIFISPEKAAELSGVSVRTVYRLLALRRFKARRSESGRQTLIDWPSFRTYCTTLPEYVAGASIPCAPQMTSARRKRARRS
jgi:hypothetical protein